MTALVLAAVVRTGCAHTPQVRPASIVIACADANFYVDHLRWKTWGARVATATGMAHQNDCKPNCAAGHEFARIGWSGRTTGRETLPCSFLELKP